MPVFNVQLLSPTHPRLCSVLSPTDHARLSPLDIYFKSQHNTTMSPSSRRKGTVRTQANTKPLDQELLARAEKRQLEEASASGEPKRVRLTTAQMGLMGLRPDPRNPERALEPINS